MNFNDKSVIMRTFKKKNMNQNQVDYSRKPDIDKRKNIHILQTLNIHLNI